MEENPPIRRVRAYLISNHSTPLLKCFKAPSEKNLTDCERHARRAITRDQEMHQFRGHLFASFCSLKKRTT